MSARALRTAGWIGLVLLGAIGLWRAMGSAESPLLRSEGGARWIKADKPSQHQARFHPMGTVRFRSRFQLDSVPEQATLSLRAYRTYRVFVNGVEVARRDDPSGWNATEQIELEPALAEGANELLVAVDNRAGPPMLLAYAPELGIATGDGWSASMWERAWHPAALASRRRPLPISSAFPSSARSLVDALPLLGLLFLAGVLGSRWKALRPVHVRWLLLAAWAVLCVHDGVALGAGFGMDVHHHLEYIARIWETGGIPYAGDGWQMFQSPLFYMIASPLYGALAEGRSENELLVALRVLPMLCGLAQIELCWRAARMLLPGRDGLQIVTLVAGGLLPINLYSAQVLSNEPLAGALTSLCLLLAFRMLIARPLAAPVVHSIDLGLCFGLALLAKVSPIVLLPLLVAVLVVHARRSGLGGVGAARLVGAFSLTSAAIAGWYYLRNWIVLGRPFVGGWDPARGIEWWQDPGYRVPEDLLSFGTALTHPVYASMSGFWDGLYASLWMDSFMSGIGIASMAPPWRSELLLAMPLLSIPLTLALLVGAVRCLRGVGAGAAERDVGRFAVACVAAFWAAMAAIFLAVPAYSSVKATYSLGVLPCYGLLIARGLEPLMARSGPRTFVSGLLAAWAGAAFLGYWIR